MPKTVPDVLDILTQDYTLAFKTSEDMPDSYGLCHLDDRHIDIREGMSDFDVRDTVLHEVMHAIRHSQGRPYGGEVEEDYVRSLATGLIAVFHRNPQFAKWLISHPRKNKT